jgi:hypothetical protein
VISAKMKLKWSRPVTIVSFLQSNVVQLANPDTGVTVRKAYVSQMKLYFRDGLGNGSWQ